MIFPMGRIIKVALLLGVAAALCNCSTPQRAWKKAHRQGTLPAYQKFLQRYPDAQQGSMAKLRIEDLISAKWKKTASINTIKGYQAFLLQNPHTKFTQPAQNKLDILMAQQDWNSAKITNSIAAYQAYLKTHPHSKHAGEAKKAFNSLLAERDWQATRKADTAQSLTAFLKKHPTTAHTTKARKRLKFLQAEEGWKVAATKDSEDGWLHFITRYPGSRRVEDAIGRLRLYDVVRKNGIVSWEALGGQTFSADGAIYYCNEKTELQFSKWTKLSSVFAIGHLQGETEGFRIAKGMALVPINR